MRTLFQHSSTGGEFPSYFVGIAYAISRDGSCAAVTWSFVPWDGEPYSVAARWTKAGGLENLGGSAANAISADGAVVAGSIYGSWWESRDRAFLWTAAQGPRDLGVPPGAAVSYGNAISGDGRTVVGHARGTSGDRACLWTADLGMVNLDDYLRSTGVELSGWVLTSARGVNANGTVIVGNGHHNGQPRGWIATVPARLHAASLKAFGSGCPGNGGIPTLAAEAGSLPWIGGSFTVRLSNLGLNPFVNVPFLILGDSKTAWGSVSLPLDLGAIGMPGCTLYSNQVMAYGLRNSAGAATWTTRIPNVASHAPTSLYLQGGVVSPSTNLLGIVLSNACEMTLGAK